MKHYRLIIGICIAFVAVGLFMWLSGLLTPMTINDISLSAELKANNISGTNGEKYVLDIEINKERSGKNINLYVSSWVWSDIHIRWTGKLHTRWQR
jgi:hypothetical protein